MQFEEQPTLLAVECGVRPHIQTSKERNESPGNQVTRYLGTGRHMDRRAYFGM